MNLTVEAQLINKIKSFKWFSLALLESTDISDTAQLAIFRRGVTEDLNVTEEFLDLIPLKDCTHGIDISEAVLHVTSKFELHGKTSCQ